MAPSEFADDPSYRSVRSIRARIGWVHLLATHDPRARDAPEAFRRAWAEYRDVAEPLVGDSPAPGATADRQALVEVLRELRRILSRLVATSGYLPEALQPRYAAAWAAIESRGTIDHAIVALGAPAVDDLLAAHGLVGPERVAKTASVHEASRRYWQHPGLKALKALLSYLDSILGSLVPVIPWLEPVKEFKEIAEASVELAGDA
jgi:hypothetical protein